HEVAGRMAAEEDPPPLQPFEVTLLDRLDPELRIARDVGTDVETVFLGLALLDLVHPLSFRAVATPRQTQRAPPCTREGAPAYRGPGIGPAPVSYKRRARPSPRPASLEI